MVDNKIPAASRSAPSLPIPLLPKTAYNQKDEKTPNVSYWRDGLWEGGSDPRGDMAGGVVIVSKLLSLALSKKLTSQALRQDEDKFCTVSKYNKNA